MINKHLLIQNNTKLSKAIEKINKNSIKFSHKVLFVINTDNMILGSITDGDIRRAIIKKNSLDYKVQDVMNKNPKIIELKSKNVQMKRFSKFEHAIPIINNKNMIIDFYFPNSYNLKRKYDNLVIIMAGGFGRRLRPLTNTIPKPLIKINNKPILEIIIENFKQYGLTNIFITTFYKSDSIKKYFQNGDRFGVSIQYLKEKKPLGTAGALSMLDKESIKKPIIVINGDIITKVNFDSLLKYHEKHNCDLTICSKNYLVKVPYGVLDFKRDNVADLLEKQSFDFQINAGIYVISNLALKELKKVKKIDMNEFIKILINKKYKIKAFPLHEYWTDIGEIDQFKKAENDIISKKI